MHSTRLTPWALLAAATAMAPLAAFASVVETSDLVAANGGNPIGSRGGNAAGQPNTIVSITPTSSATIRSITFTGTLSKVASGTFASEARIAVTRPGGTEVLLQPIGRGSWTAAPATTQDVITWRYILPAGTTANAGAWTFRFYESFVDSTTGPDANWTSLSVSFDDASTPGGVINLGTLDGTTSPIVNNGTITPNAVTWYRFTTTAPVTNPNFVDIHTLGSALSPTNDTAVALFNAATGARVGFNDNWQSATNLLGGMAISSSTASPRTYSPYTTTFTNQTAATLPAGDYLLAVFAGPAAATWAATSTIVRADGFNVGTETPGIISAFSGPSRVTLLTSAVSTNPTGVAAVNPTAVLDGASTLYTVTVTPGGNPTSTGINVVADFSAIGGAAGTALFNDGTNGDVTAGDNIWSRAVTVPSGTTAGAKAIPFTISDAQTRAGTGTVNLTVNNAPVAINLGTISESNPTLTDSRAMAAGQILWYTFTVPAGGEASATRYIDMHTFGNTITGNDTHIGLYRADGTLVTGGSPVVSAVNDDWQSALTAPNQRPSMLTFGQASPGRVYVTGTTPAFTPADGRNGTLSAGTYYLAVSGFSANFGATAFNVTTTHTRTGTSVVTILTNPSIPTDPTGSLVATPRSFFPGEGGSSLLTVTVVPGNNPVSSGVAVTADLTSIDGSATQQMFDDGTNGDVTAGDNIFSFAATVPSSTPSGARSIPFTITDAQSRTGTGSGSINITPIVPLGTLTTAVSPIVVNTTLAADEVKWYSFTTSSDASPSVYFDFHTGGSLLAPRNDTEIGLFNATTGALVASNDDAGSLRSLLSFGQTSPTRDYADGLTPAAGQTSATLPAGNYLLALAAFDTVFANGRSAISSSTNTGPARLSLVTNAPAPTLACNVADIVAIGGQPPADGILTGDDFNAFIGAFANGDLLADIVAIGGTPPGDGLITGDDFNAFIAAFATGCP